MVTIVFSCALLGELKYEKKEASIRESVATDSR